MSGISRRAHLTLWVLAASVFAASMGTMIMPGLLPGLARETGIDLAIVGRSTAVFGLAYAVAAPIVAIVVRRLSPYTVLLAALPLVAITFAWLSQVDTESQLYVARAVQAVTVAGVVPMCTVHAGTIVPPSLRSRALSISFGGMVLASLLGAPLGNLFADTIGARSAFLVLAGIVLAVWALALSARAWQVSLGDDVADAHARHGGRRGMGIASIVVLGAVLVTALLEGAATAGLNTFVSPYLTETVGATGNILSVLLLCYGVAGLAGNWLLGIVADRWGPARVLVGVTLAAAVGVAGLMIAETPLEASVFLLAWGFCSWAINPPLQALLMTHSGSRVNFFVAVNSSVIFTGSSLGAAVASARVEAGGLGTLPLVSAGLFGLSAVAAAVAWVAVARVVVARTPHADGGEDCVGDADAGEARSSPADAATG